MRKVSIYGITALTAKTIMPLYSLDDVFDAIMPSIRDTLCDALADHTPKTLDFTKSTYTEAFMSCDLDDPNNVWQQLVSNITIDPTEFVYQVMRRYQGYYARVMVEAFRDGEVIFCPNDAFPSEPAENGHHYFSTEGAFAVLPLELIDLSNLDLIFSSLALIFKSCHITVDPYSIADRYKHGSANFCRKHKIFCSDDLKKRLRNYDQFRALMPDFYTDPDVRKLHGVISQDACINAIIEHRSFARLEYPIA